MENLDDLEKLKMIVDSQASDYFESSERLSLVNLLEKLKTTKNTLTGDDLIFMKKIFKKYGRFVN